MPTVPAYCKDSEATYGECLVQLILPALKNWKLLSEQLKLGPLENDVRVHMKSLWLHLHFFLLCVSVHYPGGSCATVNLDPIT